MGNELSSGPLSDIGARVKERIQNAIIEEIPDEAWDQLVKDEYAKWEEEEARPRIREAFNEMLNEEFEYVEEDVHKLAKELKKEGEQKLRVELRKRIQETLQKVKENPEELDPTVVALIKGSPMAYLKTSLSKIASMAMSDLLNSVTPMEVAVKNRCHCGGFADKTGTCPNCNSYVG